MLLCAVTAAAAVASGAAPMIALSTQSACPYDAVVVTRSLGDAPSDEPHWLRVVSVTSGATALERIALTSKSMTTTLRLAHPDAFRVELVDSETRAISSVDLEVRSCAGDVIAPTAATDAAAAASTAAIEPQPTPSFALRGVLATDGARPLLIPNEAIEAAYGAGSEEERGGWSLSMWLYILPVLDDRDADADADADAEATPSVVDASNHRVLFFKGGGHAERTPSAALLAGTKRLHTMVSTAHQADLGATSTRDLVAGQWMHIAYAFDNYTERWAAARSAAAQGGAEEGAAPAAGACPERGCYCVRLYRDGTLDSALTFSALPRANTGDLLIGRAPGIAGIRALVANAMVLPRALDAVAARRAASGHGVSGPRPAPRATLRAEEKAVVAPDSARALSLDASRAACATTAGGGGAARTLHRALDLLAHCGGDVDDAAAALHAEASVASGDGDASGAAPRRARGAIGAALIERAVLLLECAADAASGAPSMRATARGAWGRALWYGGYGVGVGASRCRIARDAPGALALLRAAADGGHAPSATLLAHATVVGGVAARRAVRPAAAASAASLRDVDSAMEHAVDAAALALYERGAALGDPESCLVLGFRHWTGRAVLAVGGGESPASSPLGDGSARSRARASDSLVLVNAAAAAAAAAGRGRCELAAYYYRRAAENVYAAFHATGRQPLSERQVLNERTSATADQGQRGNDDERLVCVALTNALARITRSNALTLTPPMHSMHSHYFTLLALRFAW